MPKTRTAYPPAFRQQMIERVRAGRSPEDLAREFEPTAQTVRNWVAQADRDEGRRNDGLTTAEREELRRLRRENRRLHVRNGRSFQKPRPGSLGRPIRGNLRVHESESGHLPDRADVPATRCLPEWLLRVSDT